jgi:hypothetical protein
VTCIASSQSSVDLSDRAFRRQVYAADRSRVGGEFLVNAKTTVSQMRSTVRGLSSGGFVVA